MLTCQGTFSFRKEKDERVGCEKETQDISLGHIFFKASVTVGLPIQIHFEAVTLVENTVLCQVALPEAIFEKFSVLRSVPFIFSSSLYSRNGTWGGGITLEYKPAGIFIGYPRR